MDRGKRTTLDSDNDETATSTTTTTARAQKSVALLWGTRQKTQHQTTYSPKGKLKHKHEEANLEGKIAEVDVLVDAVEVGVFGELEQVLRVA